jgi:class 3 adenylate cyclase
LEVVALTFKHEVESAVAEIVTVGWDVREGQVVPKTEDIAFKDEAVRLEATYLYADLVNSSSLAQKVNEPVAARAIRAFLKSSVQIIRKYDGHIRSFDGDRVMGVFIGDSKNSHAARAALGINWAMTNVIKPKLLARWPNLEDKWKVRHAVGVDTGNVFIVRGGVRNNSDLVSVGEPANIAAKLSDIRTGEASFISKAVYSRLNDTSKISSNGSVTWDEHSKITVGEKDVVVYSSTYWKTPF